MKKIFLILIPIIILITFGVFLYQHIFYTHIVVKFKELRPFEHNIPVYYKGIVIGKAKECRHSHDYQYTEMKVILYPKNLHLPINTKVLLKKDIRNKKERDFLELIYPEEPSNELISNGTLLQGRATIDMEYYKKNVDPDDIDLIKENLTAASGNLNNTLEAIGGLFILLQDMVNENRSNLVKTTNNLSRTTGNINDATLKVNKSIKQEQLSTTFSNMELSTSNFYRITDSLYGTSVDINKTIPKINSTIQDTRDLIANTNVITCGIRQTMRKPFGGLRLIFGKTINENKCVPCGTK